MDDRTLPPENPAEEPAQLPAMDKEAAEGSTRASLTTGEGSEIEAPQPPAAEITAVQNSVALSVSAQKDARVDNSMVMAVAAGRDMTATESMTTIAAVGRDLKIEQGGAGLIQVGGKAQVEKGTVGLLIARSGVTLNNSRVIMTTQQALALGAAFGAVYALLRRLLRGKKGE